MNQSDDFGKILKLWPNLVDHYNAVNAALTSISLMKQSFLIGEMVVVSILILIRSFAPYMKIDLKFVGLSYNICLDFQINTLGMISSS
jgi:hypothetical protein